MQIRQWSLFWIIEYLLPYRGTLGTFSFSYVLFYLVFYSWALDLVIVKVVSFVISQPFHNS